jgi:phosphoenolpyruvate-protein kinase (PTS system EI component)
MGADARGALAAGADGIGLCRTEWLFVRTNALPSETVQYGAYRDISVFADDRPVTMRTVDLGGDKWPPGLPPLREANPALGLRGVRLAFAYPDLMKTQIRALFRAFEGRRLRLLIPMVNDVDDVGRARELIQEVDADIEQFEIGVMIETPAAALMADELAAAVDFFSVGTNDLTQYVLAADRDSQWTARVYQPLHPAVLRILHHAICAATRHNRPVAVCGEAASSPLAAPLLVGMGVTELSVPSTAVPRTKQLIRQVSKADARALGEELMKLPTAAAVVARLKDVGTASDVPPQRDAR